MYIFTTSYGNKGELPATEHRLAFTEGERIFVRPLFLPFDFLRQSRPLLCCGRIHFTILRRRLLDIASLYLFMPNALGSVVKRMISQLFQVCFDRLWMEVDKIVVVDSDFSNRRFCLMIKLLTQGFLSTPKLIAETSLLRFILLFRSLLVCRTRQAAKQPDRPLCRYL